MTGANDLLEWLGRAWTGLLAPLPRLWPIALVLLAAAWASRLHGPLWTPRRRLGLDDVDQLGGEEFERWLGGFFQHMGYQVRHVGGSGDYGADLVLTYQGYHTVVQAKRSIKPIGVGAIQEAAAARAHYGAHHAMVVTNHSFTVAAVELARTNSVELWDRERLAAEMVRFS